MWFSIEQIRTLAAIAESGSFSSASKHLRKAKSALSVSIQNLEDQLGFKLLDRSQYRVQLTPKGRAFMFRAQRLLDESESLKEYAQLIASNMEMKLSLSATMLFPIEQLIPLLVEIRERFPNTQIEFHREVMSGTYMLQDETTDIAVIAGPIPHHDLHLKKIGLSHMPICLAPHHPFWKTAERSFVDLQEYPNIVQASTVPDQRDNITLSHKKWRVHDYESKLALIKAGLGWGRLPCETITEELERGELVIYQDDLIVDIYVAYRSDRPLGQVGQFIWEYFPEKT